MNWTYFSPTRVRFGYGAATAAANLACGLGSSSVRPPVSGGAEVGGGAMIVTDATVSELPSVRSVIDRFEGAEVFREVEPNPTVANVDALARRVRERGSDVLVAIGGGSSMDCAKAASCLARSGYESIRGVHSEGCGFSEEDGAIPLVALPTTAGTGSEVTPFAVLDDREKGVKAPIACDLFYPVLAIVDPELTLTAPRRVTAATALDALSHAMEGYWSKNHQPICDLFALDAARRILEFLPAVLNDPADTRGREELSYAALLAGLAFQLPKNAILHACSFPLSNRFHLDHGAACAFLMEQAIGFNAPGMGGRMERFASYCGLRDVEALVSRVRELKVLGGLPCSLEQAGIPEDAVDQLVEDSFHPLMNNNPVPVTAGDLQSMYRELKR